VFVVEVYGPDGESRRDRVDVDEVTIGRHSTNDIRLPRGSVSKRHARVVQCHDTIIVVDLKSTNGTYVNGRKLDVPAIVRRQDVIYIGDYRVFVDGDNDGVTTHLPLPPFVARDPREHRLLAEIAARDDAARVVYADWLEERGELDRAELLRVQQEIVECAPDDPRLEALASRLRALAWPLDAPWRRRVARPVIERCAVAFELECPKEWGQLEPTERDLVRYCGSCKKTVHYAATVAEARRHAERGNCVAIDVSGTRWGRDLDPPYGRFVCELCNVDVGPGVRDCPICQAPVEQPMRRMGVLSEPPGQ